MNEFCPTENGSSDESVHPFWYAIAPPKPTVTSTTAISTPTMPAKIPTRRRRENAAGDRPDLRDHEQRRKDSDEDDCRHHHPAHGAIAGHRLGRELLPAKRLVREAREHACEKHRSARDHESVPEHRRDLFGIQLLPSCEPFFQAMPVCNLVLAEAPAEQDLLAVPEGGEVDEPLVEIF